MSSNTAWMIAGGLFALGALPWFISGNYIMGLMNLMVGLALAMQGQVKTEP